LTLKTKNGCVSCENQNFSHELVAAGVDPLHYSNGAIDLPFLAKGFEGKSCHVNRLNVAKPN